MKIFSSDVVALWRNWKVTYHHQMIKDDEAYEELQILRELVLALKKYHN